MPFRKTLFPALCLSGAICLSGCGRPEPPRLTVFPVTGKVLVDGQPAEKAVITLQPSQPLQDAGGRTMVPAAIVAADGSFRVGTYLSDDGAPPGDYALTIIWPRYKAEGGEEVPGADRLRSRYNNAGDPPAKVHVEQSPVVVPDLQLKTK
jgi:hypothetical protein